MRLSVSKVGANMTGVKGVNNVFLNQFGISGLAETSITPESCMELFFFLGGGYCDGSGSVP